MSLGPVVTVRTPSFALLVACRKTARKSWASFCPVSTPGGWAMGMTMHMATLMNRSKSKGGKSAGTANLILAFGLVAAIASIGYHWIATQHEFDKQDRAAPTVFADPRAKGNDAVAIVAAQMHELTWRPLSQNALNRLLVAARLSGQRALEDRVDRKSV